MNRTVEGLKALIQGGCPHDDCICRFLSPLDWKLIRVGLVAALPATAQCANCGDSEGKRHQVWQHNATGDSCQIAGCPCPGLEVEAS